MRCAFSRYVARKLSVFLFLPLLLATAHGQDLAPANQGGSAGRLILRGELIAPPYSVEIIGDTITVNGVSIARPREWAVPAADLAISDNVRHGGDDRQNVFRDFWSAWDAWCAQLGVEAAEEKALQYWRAAPGVLLASFPNPQHRSQLRVQFVGEAQAESIELRPPSSDAVSPEEARSQILQQLAASLRGSLALGELVVMQDEGYSFSTPPGEGAALLQTLAAIADATADSSERYQAVRQLVPDDAMARDIAEHFRP